MENDNKEGFGILIDNIKKTFYEGFWKNNNKEGLGIELFDVGIYIGNFYNNLINEMVKILLFQWKLLWRLFINNKKEGKGKYINNKGKLFEGNWKNNKL